MSSYFSYESVAKANDQSRRGGGVGLRRLGSSQSLMVDDDKLATVVSIETNYFRALKVLKDEEEEEEQQQED